MELKKDDIDLNALGQICRYKIGLSRFFNELAEKKGSKYLEEVEISGILVGSDYASGDICYAVDSIDWLECYHYTLDLGEGIKFEESDGWHNSGENFEKLHEKIKDFKEEYLRFYKYEIMWKSREDRRTRNKVSLVK